MLFRLDDALQTLTFTEKEPVSCPCSLHNSGVSYNDVSAFSFVSPQNLQSFYFLLHYLPPSFSIHYYRTVTFAVLLTLCVGALPTNHLEGYDYIFLFTHKLTVFLSQEIA